MWFGLFGKCRSCRLAVLLCAGLLAGCSGSISAASYGNLARDLRAMGHLRTDRAPPDVPLDARELVRAFRDIAFAWEFHFRDGAVIAERLEKPLNRWSGTIRYSLAGDAYTRADTTEIAAVTAEIAALTGLTFRRVEGAHDLTISIATPAGRAAISRDLEARGTPVYRRRYDLWRADPRWICGATLSGATDGSGRIVEAHVFLRAEVTGLLRRACLHEEIAQVLGLTNDSDSARPSIFNDDQEFALLTAHDAILLRTLYDPRLRPGMSAATAMPIVERIIAEEIGRLHARQALGPRAAALRRHNSGA